MHLKKILSFLFVVSIFISAQNTFASSEEEKKTTNLSYETVVSATRSQISLFDVPQDVTIITSEEIAASPFERVEDIVRSVPGLFNFTHYGLQTHGIGSSLIMRGVGLNRLLVLVDGMPPLVWIALNYGVHLLMPCHTQ